MREKSSSLNPASVGHHERSTPRPPFIHTKSIRDVALFGSRAKLKAGDIMIG